MLLGEKGSSFSVPISEPCFLFLCLSLAHAMCLKPWHLLATGVDRVMSSPVWSISGDANFKVAKATMKRHKASCLLVDCGPDRPSGLVTKRSLMRASVSRAGRQLLLRDILKGPVISVNIGAAKLVFFLVIRSGLVEHQHISNHSICVLFAPNFGVPSLLLPYLLPYLAACSFLSGKSIAYPRNHGRCRHCPMCAGVMLFLREVHPFSVSWLCLQAQRSRSA